MTANDYPSSELNRGISGAIDFTLAINASGVVTDCTVTRSSGSLVLDTTACAILKSKGEFKPARDGNGKKVAGYYSSRFLWKIPTDNVLSLPEKATQWIMEVDVSDKGVVERCVLHVSDSTITPPPTARSPCTAYPVGSKVRPMGDKNGKTVRFRVRVTHRTEVEPL
ncbi:MAG: TonB family protein [Sphingobium sp.]